MSKGWYKKLSEAQREKIRVRGRVTGRVYYAAHKGDADLKNMRWAKENPVKRMLHQARSNAKRRGIPFLITEKDLVIPVLCPVLGLKLEFFAGFNAPQLPSIDRLRPELGYVPGNVRVISWRANRLKVDCVNPEELRAVAAYIENNVF